MAASALDATTASAQQRTLAKVLGAEHRAGSPFLDPIASINPPSQAADVQTRWLSELQPVPLAVSLSSSSTVHRRAPTELHKASDSAYAESFLWQTLLISETAQTSVLP